MTPEQQLQYVMHPVFGLQQKSRITCPECGRKVRKWSSLEEHLASPKHPIWCERKTAKEAEKGCMMELSSAQCDAPVVVVESPDEVLVAVRELSSERVVGFDSEWRPDRTKGVSHPIELIQLATEDKVFIFRLGRCGFPRELSDFLQRPSPLKVGVGLHNDLKKLSEHFKGQGFSKQGFCDLAIVAPPTAGPFRGRGLRKLVARFLSVRVDKREQCSDWGSDVLTPAQISYAALDAWLCRQLFTAIYRAGAEPTGALPLPNLQIELTRPAATKEPIALTKSADAHSSFSDTPDDT
mmetsp:Transcript_2723/g.6562  ORF Transcript_2723/g.6562 Transcript_2723/m.6562 type:complete len:295 (+) Transcript_2723:44-928(+)|eukprot:CAMPEP_0114541948 /NCGR_PEP_ID=MMETSP0114-20121206/1576_1 /TAXON_ID=31324 /ORGANISM="Goniomonas sp, Strain m" /LENGTH=294 /DNA_ID=CAMNT_0001726217 /DNA_START=44 /DNA_END=928 /DNA_ORIENTATION=+